MHLRKNGIKVALSDIGAHRLRKGIGMRMDDLRQSNFNIRNFNQRLEFYPTFIMKLGILSDTHGILHPALRHIFADVDYIIHAGDIGCGTVLQELSLIAPTIAVRGNIDGEEHADLPKVAYRILDGVRIVVTHNAGDAIRPAHAYQSQIIKSRTDFLISGHYHGYWCVPLQTPFGEALWLSPGACGNAGHHQTRMALKMQIAPQSMRTGDWKHDVQLEKIMLGARGEAFE